MKKILLLIFVVIVSTRAASAQDGTLRRINVPILMYHYVSALPEDADEYRVNLTVEPDLFEAHLQYLAAAEYRAVSLYEVHDALLNGTPLPPKPIVLTFDDGHIDHYTHVFPLLQQYGFTGTFFVITGLADQNHPDHLSWAQIQAMAAAGMHMEAHTKSHVDLRNRDRDFLVYEILGSQESLRAHTNQPTQIFAYPAGRYDDLTLSILGETDIIRAVTTQPGAALTTDNRLELPRLRIDNDTGVPGLIKLLEGK